MWPLHRCASMGCSPWQSARGILYLTFPKHCREGGVLSRICSPGGAAQWWKARSLAMPLRWISEVPVRTRNLCGIEFLAVPSRGPGFRVRQEGVGPQGRGGGTAAGRGRGGSGRARSDVFLTVRHSRRPCGEGIITACGRTDPVGEGLWGPGTATGARAVGFPPTVRRAGSAPHAGRAAGGAKRNECARCTWGATGELAMLVAVHSQ